MNSNDIKKYFGGKKITVMGLGLLGRGVGDVIFLARAGANLTVTDIKTKEQLAEALKEIRAKLGDSLYRKINFVLGRHRLKDFQKCDYVLKAGGVPIDSPYIAEAKKHKIPVKMDESWLVELADIFVVGITGTKGKSTVTNLIYKILVEAAKATKSKQKVYLGGNVKGVATLPLLEKVKTGDIVVMELDAWRLQGFGDAGISPEISVFTNFMVDHQNYYGSTSFAVDNDPMDLYFADKANIFTSQKKDHLLIAGTDVVKIIKKKFKKINSTIITPDVSIIPKNWKIKVLGEHNRFNIACAIYVAYALNVPMKTIRKAVEEFTGLPGRLEFIREKGGIKFYNDTNATTPDSVIKSLRALTSSLKSKKSGIVLLGGGADKKLDYTDYIKELKKSPIKALILFKGAATDKILSLLPGEPGFPVFVTENMPLAMGLAVSYAEKGDIVLLSPGASSFGVFINEYDRGEQFNKIVKSLK